MTNTYVISAKFSKKSNLDSLSDLEKSLTNLNFRNYLIFDHNQIKSPNLNIKYFNSIRINPLGRIPKLLREFLRIRKIKLNSKMIKMTKQKLLFLMIPHNLRLFYTLELLKNLRQDDFVFLVDSRDLIFQIDPNEISKKLSNMGDLHFFDERMFHFKTNKKQFLKDSAANIYWIDLLNETVGIDKFNLNDKFIINTGCIAGKVETVRNFLEIACENLDKSPYKLHEILDQAIVNLLAYSRLLGTQTFCIHENGNFVLNMCGVISEPVRLKEGKITTSHGITPIVHQYDRFTNFDPTVGLKIRNSPYTYQKNVNS